MQQGDMHASSHLQIRTLALMNQLLTCMTFSPVASASVCGKVRHKEDEQRRFQPVSLAQKGTDDPNAGSTTCKESQLHTESSPSPSYLQQLLDRALREIFSFPPRLTVIS